MSTIDTSAIAGNGKDQMEVAVTIRMNRATGDAVATLEQGFPFDPIIVLLAKLHLEALMAAKVSTLAEQAQRQTQRVTAHAHLPPNPKFPPRS